MNNKRINTKVLGSFIKQALSYNKYFEERDMRRRRLQIYGADIIDLNKKEQINEKHEDYNEYNKKRKNKDEEDISVIKKFKKNEKVKVSGNKKELNEQEPKISTDQIQYLAEFKSFKKYSNEESDEFDDLFLEIYEYYNRKAVETWDHSGYMELYGSGYTKKRKYKKKITRKKRRSPSSSSSDLDKRSAKKC